MREIKFRAYNKLVNKMVFLDMTDLRSVSEELISNSNNIVEFRQTLQSKWMQFTGLKDIKEREIYEGDVVNQYGFKAEGVVTFGTYKRKNFSNHDRQVKHLGWYIKPIPFYSGSTNILWNKDIESLVATQNGIEIIGNIYENPELTRGQDES